MRRRNYRRRVGRPVTIIDADTPGYSIGSAGTVELLSDDPKKNDQLTFAALCRAADTSSNSLLAELCAECPTLMLNNVSKTTGLTPLMSVSRTGNLKGIRILCSSGCNVNSPGRLGLCPLAFASLHGQHAAVKLLIRRGALCNTVDDVGKTAEMHAYDSGYVELSKEIKNLEKKQRRHLRRIRNSNKNTENGIELNGSFREMIYVFTCVSFISSFCIFGYTLYNRYKPSIRKTNR